MLKGAAVFLFSVFIYFNSVPCGFVFDDASAVRDNQDLRPSTNWTDLFKNDFWGTPMNQERSHKSYRPITVLTFRLNYMLSGLNPSGYHIANVILHASIGVLFFKLCSIFLTSEGAFVAALYFAAHPVHTEAVTGVVGRAELLSCMVGILSLLLYLRIKDLAHFTHWLGVTLIGLMLSVGTLCKEQCITFVGVFGAYELTLQYRFLLSSYRNLKSDDPRPELDNNKKYKHRQTREVRGKRRPDNSDQPTMFCFIRFALKSLFWLRGLYRITALALFAGGIMYFRMKVMGSQLPHFTEFDNPAAHAQPLIRRLTHLYLVPINILLLIFPSGLCADWTLGSLRLITGWADPRNLMTVIIFSVLLILGLIAFHPRTSYKRSVILGLGLSLMAFPFLPASNLFFPVGFVVAERILYIPSLGLSLLFGYGYQSLVTLPASPEEETRDYSPERKSSIYKPNRRLWRCLVAFVITAFALKTIRRNFDWMNEYTLFSSALKVNPNNAKMWNNVGHSLEAEGRFREALGYFRKAVLVQPNDIGARINVGRTYVNLNMPEEAEQAYFGALDYFPKPKKGMTYYARVAPKDLMVFINLANLYLNKTPPQLEDASLLLRRAISLRSDFVDAYQNYGSVLIKQGRLNEAESAYRTAIGYQERSPDLHYNLAVVLLEVGRTEEGLQHLNQALSYDPDHLPSRFALASTLTESNDTTRRHLGKLMMQQLVDRNFETIKVHFALGMLETDDKHYEQAVKHYRKVVELEPTHRSALFNLALLLRNQFADNEGAVPILEHLIKAYPDHVKSLLLLGDIALTENRDLKLAKQLFLKAIILAPDSIQAKHNYCVVLAEEGNLEASETCLMEAMQMAPNDTYLQDHLDVVRKRLAMLSES
ncbi:unnamed protein product [Calicophoron daubneyi]|uniref:dolichyl-phosphate-mannose--protein mannosyltransferase n=1 Tax=Calicophoron daubneyi TaxID=300641 RepID=A0AAV2T6C3_CALDB